MSCKRVEVGQMFRGQAWVALHGDFTIERLKSLVLVLEENCRGLGKNDNQERHNNRLESVAENN